MRRLRMAKKKRNESDCDPETKPRRILAWAPSHLVHTIAKHPTRSYAVLDELLERAETESQSDLDMDSWAAWLRREAAIALAEEMLRTQGRDSWELVEERISRLQSIHPRAMKRSELRAWSAIRGGTQEVQELIAEEILDAMPSDEDG